MTSKYNVNVLSSVLHLGQVLDDLGLILLRFIGVIRKSTTCIILNCISFTFKLCKLKAQSNLVKGKIKGQEQ